MKLIHFVFVGGMAISLFTTTAAASADWANSDGSCFTKGDKTVSGGLSVANFGFFAAYDMGFNDAISGGVVTGFNGYSDSYWSYNDIPVLIRAGFHPFNLTVLKDKIKIRDKLDVYVGPSVGWQIGWTSWKGEGIAIGSVGYGGFILREFIGASWYFTPNFFATVQDCAGLGLFNFGVGFRF